MVTVKATTSKNVYLCKFRAVKNLLFIFVFGFLFINNSLSQSIKGVYHGSLISDKNLIYIEEVDGNTSIKIFFSEKESIQVFGEFSKGKLTFPLPLYDGQDLVIFAEQAKSSTNLNIEFALEGKNYNTILEKIESPKRNLEKTWFEQPINTSFDPSIVGKWVHYLTTDSEGEVLKDHLLNKKPYVTSFVEKGVVLYDLQMIRDLFKEFGYNQPLDYTKIPKANWYTTDNNQLTITIDGKSIIYLYEVSPDSLKLKSEKGYTQYYVKK